MRTQGKGELDGLEILVVEDDTDSRGFLARLLQDCGARVTTAADGAEAIQAASAGVYDLILTDLRMPEMDGLELLRAVRRLALSAHVVLITAYGDCASFTNAMDLGADAFVRKPFTVPQLLQVIRSAMSRVA
jgi:two-component system response regulator PilR (NtrC family)